MIGLVTDSIWMIRDIRASSRLFGMWGAALNIPQLLGGLIFITRPEGVLILAACAGSIMVAAQMHKRTPFTRLSSIVHVVWLPLFPYLAEVLAAEGIGGAFGAWLAYVVVVIGISLILDVRNLALYWFSENREFEGSRP